MTDDAWNYFTRDTHYSNVLKDRLSEGIEMDSAKAMGTYLDQTCSGDLYVLDFGAGPGHYYPVLKRHYTMGTLRYVGVDIDQSNVDFGSEYFRDDPAAELVVGSVLEPAASVPADVNCIVSANTLPHVPAIRPLLELLAHRASITRFVFRMLIGDECVQIKKHLRQHDFDQMFERDFQFNNIYSLPYLTHYLGNTWDVRIAPDVFDAQRLEQHHLPAQDVDCFYGNRVSRNVGSMVFKGDVYMPWKFVLGRRIAASP